MLRKSGRHVRELQSFDGGGKKGRMGADIGHLFLRGMADVGRREAQRLSDSFLAFNRSWDRSCASSRFVRISSSRATLISGCSSR